MGNMTITLTPEQIAWAESIEFVGGGGAGIGSDGTCRLCVEQTATALMHWHRTGALPAPGEPIPDHDNDICRVIRRGAMAVNDSWAWQGDAAARTAALRPVLFAQLGTRSTPEVEEARAMLARRFAVRIAAPYWLARAGFTDDAAALRALVVTPETRPRVATRCRRARSTTVAAVVAVDAALAADAAAAYAAAYADARTLLTRYCGVLLAMCAITAETAADVLANDRTEVSDV